MKILLDENLPHRLRAALGERDVVTVDFMGWSGLKNGQLLRQAEESGIDVLVTADQTLQYEQSLAGRRIGVVVLSAQKWPIISQHMPDIERALDECASGSFALVDCGINRRDRRKKGETRI